METFEYDYFVDRLNEPEDRNVAFLERNKWKLRANDIQHESGDNRDKKRAQRRKTEKERTDMNARVCTVYTAQ